MEIRTAVSETRPKSYANAENKTQKHAGQSLDEPSHQDFSVAKRRLFKHHRSSADGERSDCLFAVGVISDRICQSGRLGPDVSSRPQCLLVYVPRLTQAIRKMTSR